MNKNEYRRIYKQKRQALSKEEKADFDVSIYKQLIALDWSVVKYVHIYISIEKFQEPDTSQLISYLRTYYPSINIVLSQSNFESGILVNYIWDDKVVLEKNKWGILEPKSGTIVKEEWIDIVIVPLLITDHYGNRVGYGKGFYDRFLVKCRPNVQKIGLSYYAPVDHIEDVDAWDIPVDCLITPAKEYLFN